MDPTPLFTSTSTFRRFWLLSQSLVPGLFDGHVPDPRDRRGRRWSFAPLMMSLWLGILTNRQSLQGIERLSCSLLGKTYGIWRRISDSTLWDLLGKLCAAAVRAQLVEMVRRMHRMKAFESDFPLRVVSIDGKVTHSEERVNVYCQRRNNDGWVDYLWRRLNAVLISSPLLPIVMQVPIRARTNEVGALMGMVEALQKAYGHSSLFDTLMFDSGFASLGHMHKIRQAHLHFIVAIKDNQPELHREILRLFKRRFQGRFEVEMAWEKYQGEVIRRRLWRTEQIAGYLGWPIAQAWVLEQTTRHKDGTEKVELRCFVTSVEGKVLSGQQIVWLIRQHWGIENGVHWTVDKVWQEDRMPWCRKGEAVEVIDLLRAMALNVLHYLRYRHLRSPRKRTWTAPPWGKLAAWREMIEEVLSELVHLARWERERKDAIAGT